MREGMIVASALLVLILWAPSRAAFAQMDPAGDTGPMMQGDSGKDVSPEQLSDMKSRILAKIEERRKRMEQEKACVEAATTMEELRKCRPEGPGGGGQRPMGGGPQGRQGGPRGAPR